MSIVRTRGDVVVNEIKVGDIHYEYDYGMEIKIEVITKPVKDSDGYWVWKSVTQRGEVVDYGVHERYAHYGPKLYTYQAYKVPRKL